MPPYAALSAHLRDIGNDAAPTGPWLGYCATTDTGEGTQCLAREVKGTWTASGLDECASKCASCERCRFFSYSAGFADCSWFSECKIDRLNRNHGDDYFWGRFHTTFRRRRDDGSLRRWHDSQPEVLHALARYQEQLSRLGPLPRVLHTTFKTHIDMDRARHPLIKHTLQSFRKYNPQWKIELSDDKEIEFYLKSHLPAADYARMSDLHIVEKTDIWRILKIWREGGLYGDIDRLANQDLNKKITNKTKLVLPISFNSMSGTNQGFDFSQDFFGSAPQNPLFARALNHVLRQRESCVRRCGKCEMGTHNELCTTLDLGPGVLFRIASMFLWGKALLPPRLNVSLLAGLNPKHTTYIRPQSSTQEFFDHGAPPHIISFKEGGLFDTMSFQLTASPVSLYGHSISTASSVKELRAAHAAWAADKKRLYREAKTIWWGDARLRRS